ncbi:facilitated trehalose transporter Tret1-2 homolog [Penaeus vannamei]|uniref:facilitated trehalose transporter Tret1-2 homolog n=1 Tax=Penaeus vannamei TaxID=6689 RepID=UPI00387F7C4A
MPPLKTFGEAEIGVAEDTTSIGQINPAFVGIHEDEATDLARAATPVAEGGPAEDKTGSTDAKRPPPSGRISPSDLKAKGKQFDLVKELITGEDLVKAVGGSGTAWKADEGQRNGDDTGQPAPDAGPALGTQALGVVMASLTHLAIGTIVGLPGVTLPQLTDPNTEDIFLDTAQVALFGSLVHIGAIVGSLVGGALNLRLGQRVTLLIAMPLSLALWLALAFSPAVWMVQVARTLLGVAQGLAGAAANNYVVEVAHTSVRGRFAGFVDTARQLGFLFAYVVGSTGLSWRHVSLVCGFVTAIPPFIGLLFLPNSPRWLVTRGRLEEAHKALKFYRGPRYDVSSELSAITEQIDRTSSSTMGTKDQLRLLREPSVSRRLVLLTFLMFILQFTGNITIATYVVTILKSSNTGVDAYTSAMLVGGIRVVGTVAFLLLVDRVGRKAIVLATCVACSVCLTVFGVYFYLQNQSADLSHLTWLPLTVLLLYMPLVCALEAATCLLRGELLPTNVRAVGAALMYIFFFLGMFATAHSFPASVSTIGEHGVFWLYAGSCLLMAAVVGLSVPETRGLSLEQIDDFFRAQRKRTDASQIEKDSKS